MNHAPPDNVTPRSHTRTAALNLQERMRGATSRKVAFAAMAAISLPACGAAIFSWYVWAVTVKVCVDAYIVQTIEPPLLSSEQLNWLETCCSLDISSFSAAIVALLFTRLAFVGCRNTWQWAARDRAAYFEHVHHSVLFSEEFDTLAIRLGLLGTLLSFLLAALTQMSDVSAREPQPRRTTLQDRIAAVATDATDAASLGAESRDRLATSRLSEHMFLLLCASLVSTFVGTGVAYVITPCLNWVHDRATGRHQIGDVDAETAVSEFLRQLERTTQRLEQFETTSIKLTAAAEHMTSFEVNVGNAARHLASLLAGLETALVALRVSNQNSHELAAKLNSMDAQFKQLRELLQQLPARLNTPLESISRSSARFKDAAQAGEVAFRELQTASSSVQDSLHDTAQRSKVMWKLLHEVRDSLTELAHSERLQTDELARVGEAFKSHDSLLRQLREQQSPEPGGGDDAQNGRPLTGGVDPRGTSGPRDSEDHGDRSGSGAPYRQQASYTPPRRTRPWWRRWLG